MKEYATDFWYCATGRSLRCGQCVSDHCPIETKNHLQGSNLPHFASNFLLKYSDIPYDLRWSLRKSTDRLHLLLYPQIITPTPLCLTVGTRFCFSNAVLGMLHTSLRSLTPKVYRICSLQRILLFSKTEEIYLHIHLRKLNAFAYWQLICAAFYELHGHDSEPFLKFSV